MKVRLDLDLTFNQFKTLLTYFEKNDIEVLQSNVEMVTTKEQEQETYNLHGKPQTEISKLKLFMDIFNDLSGEQKEDVEEKIFIHELFKTGKFSGDDVKNFINKSMQNGQIYERRSGYYAKA